MAFMTPEQMAEVRLRNSKPVLIEELGRTIRIVKLSAAKAVEAQQLQSDASALKGQGPALRALMLFMLQAACADEHGKMLDLESAEQILELVPLDSMLKLLGEINAVSDGEGKPKGNSEASRAGDSSSASA